MITAPDRRQKRIHYLAKRNQIVRPEQAAARRETLKIVYAPQRRPGNRDADEDRTDRTVSDVADHRNIAHGHMVMNPKPPALQRMKRMRDQSVTNITRPRATACI